MWAFFTLCKIWALFSLAIFKAEEYHTMNFSSFLFLKQLQITCIKNTLERWTLKSKLPLRIRALLSICISSSANPAVPVAGPDFDGTEKCQNLL